MGLGLGLHNKTGTQQARHRMGLVHLVITPLNHLTEVGMTVQTSIKNKISQGSNDNGSEDPVPLSEWVNE